jgi:hypothetical protein
MEGNLVIMRRVERVLYGYFPDNLILWRWGEASYIQMTVERKMIDPFWAHFIFKFRDYHLLYFS